MLLLIILTSLFMTNSSYAANFHGYYSCGKVIKYDKDDNSSAKGLLVSWFRGFYSGVNWIEGYNSDEYPDDVESIYYAIIKYCKENPLKDSADASMDIYHKITDNYLYD